jgi:hypothetical protein
LYPERTSVKDTDQRARLISEMIEQARGRGWPIGARFRVTVRGGCVACDPGVCTECGHLLTGETYTIAHLTHGQRVISDRAVHYLGHGITQYATGYVVHDEPVIVEMDLEELAQYLDL